MIELKEYFWYFWIKKQNNQCKERDVCIKCNEPLIE